MKKFLLFLTVAVSTAFSAQADVHYALNESFEGQGLPAGWTQEYRSLPIRPNVDTVEFSWGVEHQSASDTLRYPLGAFEGDGRAFARNATTDEMRFVTRLVTPQFSLTGIFQPQVLFAHAEVARAGASDTLRVYYRNETNGVWRPLDNAEFYRVSNWHEETISLPNPSAHYQLCFEISENFGRGVVLDAIRVRSTPTCLGVENVTARQIHAHDAQLVWDAPGSYNEFQVLLSKTMLPNPEQADPEQIIAVYSGIYNPEFSLTNLDPQTTYYAYVRSDCNELPSGWTPYVGVDFRTLTLAFLPYEENFNQGVAIEGYSGFALPEGWLVFSDMDSVICPFIPRGAAEVARQHYSIDTTAYLAFNATMSTACDPIPAGKYALAVSPEFVVSSLQNVEVSFWATAYDKITHGIRPYASSLEVGVMTDPSDATTFVKVGEVSIESQYLFKHYVVNLSSYTGAGKYIALRSAYAQPNAIYIDNFEVRQPLAYIPTALKASAVSANGFTLSALTHGADSWEVKISEQYSRTGDVSTVLYTQAGITGNNVVVNLTDGSLAGKVVCVYARTTKGGQTSAWSFPLTIRVPQAMPALPMTYSFEASEGQISLSALNHEIRHNANTMAPATVYFPLTSQETEANSFPRLISTAPNYRGAHLQICGIDNWFVLPEVNNVSTLQAVFRYATLANQSGQIEVGVMTDPYDLTTFSSVATFSAERSTKYQRCLVTFDGYQGTGRYIAFVSRNAGSGEAASVNLIDEVVVSVLGDCREASNFATTTHAHEATISWNGSNMDGWIFEFGTSPTLMNASQTPLSEPTITLTGLDPETHYYYAVTTICQGDTMLAEDVHEFETPRGLPFFEGFAARLSEGWYTGFGLASDVFGGSVIQESTSTYGWSLSNSSTYRFSPQSGYVAYASTARSTYAPSAGKWLVGPQMYLDSDADEIEMTFDLGLHNASATEFGAKDKFMVLVSVDGGNTWSETNAVLWDNEGKGQYSLNDLNWETSQRISVDFSQYLNRRIRFAFYVEAQSAQYTNYISVDNITLRVADAACGGVSQISATGLSETTGQVRWLLGGVNPHPAILLLSLTSNFQNVLRADTIQGNSFTYTDLDASTHYYVRIRQNCQNDPEWQMVDFNTHCSDETVEQFGTETFTESGALDCWTKGFIYNNGSGTLPQRKSTSAYGNVLQIEKNSVDSTASDGAYALTPQFAVADTINRYQVVFDALTYNNSETNVHRLTLGVVSDPADIGFTMSPIASVNLQYATDSLGFKTYVVSLEDYDGDPFGDFGRYICFLSEAGADSTNYVYIDNVRLELAQGCHQVIDLEADTLSAVGAHLTWTGNAEAYEIIITDTLIRPASYDLSQALVHDTVSTLGYRVRGLQATTTYYAYIRSLCDEEVSPWSSATRFTTSFGLPFVENWTGRSFTEGIWTRYSGLFVGDSILGTQMTTTTSGFSEVNNYSETVTGMSGYVARANIWSTSGRYWFVSPNLDLSVDGDAEIRFTWKMAVTPYSSSGTAVSSSTDKRLGVLISTDDGATWRKRDGMWWTCTGEGNNFKALTGAARTYQMDMTDYQNRSVRIAFYGESTGSSTDLYYYFDSIQVVKYEAVCLGVRQFEAKLVGDTTAVARWNILGQPTEVEVVLSEDPDFINVIRRDTTSLDSIVYHNLNYTRTYYIRATQVDCDESTAKVVTVNTPLVIPYAQTFNSKTLPEDWTVMKGAVADAFVGTNPVPQTGSSFGWKANTTNNGLPANHIYAHVANSSNDKFWIVSPEIALNVAATDSIQANFDVAITNYDGAAVASNKDKLQLRMLVSTDGGDTWSEQNSYLFSNVDTAYMRLDSISNTGTRVSIDLSAFRGERVRIAFYEESAAMATVRVDFHIANFELRVPASCDDPSNLVASDITAGGATLTWSGDSAIPSVVEIATSSTFAGARVDTVMSGESYVLHGLLPDHTYYVRVAQVCGDMLTGYSKSVTFTTSLGLPFDEPMDTRPTTWSNFTTTSVADGLAGGTRTMITGTTSGWRASTLATILGGNHIYAVRTTKALWFMSPTIDLTPNVGEDILFHFDMSLTRTPTSPAGITTPADYDACHFHVFISTDEGETWTAGYLWSKADTANYSFVSIPAAGETYNLDLSAFGGQKIRVAFVLGEASKGTSAININNVVMESLATRCFGVKSIEVSKLDTAAYFNLVPNDDAHLWQVVCNGDTQIIDTTAFAVHGLRLDATYSVMARSICGEGDTSVWCTPMSFTMPHGLAYDDDLHGQFDEWTRYTGVFNATSGYTYTDSLQQVATGWMTSNSPIQLGAAHVYSTTSTTTSNWLVSPLINLQNHIGRNPIYLSFNMALTGSASSASAPSNAAQHRFRVAISEDGGKSWKYNNCYLWSNTDAAAVAAGRKYTDIPAGKGRSYHVALTRYAGKEIRIALIKDSCRVGTSAIHINDIHIDEYVTPCFAVSDLRATLEEGMAHCVITPDDASRASAYQYEVVAAGAAPTGKNAYTVSGVDFYTYPLPKSSTLDIYVRALCGANDTSAWYGPATVTTPLGIRYVNPMTSIDDCKVYTSSDDKNFTLSSGTWMTKTCTNWGGTYAYINAYSTRHYMLATPVIDFDVDGSAVQLSFDIALTKYNQTTAPTNTAGQSFEVRASTDRGATWSDPLAVWSDENPQADYSYSGIPTMGANYSVDLSEYIGENVMIGFYSLSSGVSGVDNDVFIRNVVVDTISAGSICGVVRSAALLDSTYTSATLKLRGAGIRDAQTIEYKVQPQNTIFRARQTCFTDTNIIHIDSLENSMGYDFYARVQCQDSSWTEWTGPFTFHTVECSSVTGIQVDEASLSSVRFKLLSADAAAALGYYYYIVEHDGILDPTAAIFTRDADVTHIQPLRASSMYDVYARKICQVGDTSDWTGPYTFMSPYGVRYEENFEWATWSSEWQRYEGQLTSLSPASSGWSVGRAGNGFAEAHVYVNSYSTYRRLMVSPRIDLSQLTPDKPVLLNIDLALTRYNSTSAPSSTANQSFYILVSEDGTTWDINQGFAWTAAGDLRYADIPADGETYELDLSPYIGQAVYLGLYAVCTSSGADNDVHVQNLVIDTVAATTCGKITNIVASNVSLSSATIELTYDGLSPAEADSAHAVIEIATNSDFSMILATDTVIGKQYLLSSLSPSTTYYVHARRLCADGQLGRWSRSLGFTTSLGVRYVEDFEDISNLTTSGWRQGTGLLSDLSTGTPMGSTTSGWAVSAASKGMDSKHIRVNVYGTSVRYWAVSPVIDLTPNVGQSLLFAFDAALTYYYSSDTNPADAPDDQFAVVVSEDGIHWSEANATIWGKTADQTKEHHYMDLGFEPQRFYVDFSQYAGRNIYIGFYGESTVTNGDNYLQVDNLDLSQTNGYDYNDTICEGTPYENYGFLFSEEELAPGQHSYTRLSESNDSIIRLNLFVRPSEYTQFTDTVCEGQRYTGYGYDLLPTRSDVYRRVLSSVNGCDSTIMLHLTVHPIQRVEEEHFVCRGQSYTIQLHDGTTRTFWNNGYCVDTLSSLTSGCDSIVTHYVTFSATEQDEAWVRYAVCAGDEFCIDDDHCYSSATSLDLHSQSMYGCDSTTHIRILEVNPTTDAIVDTVEVSKLPYLWGEHGERIVLNRGASIRTYTYTVMTTCGAKQLSLTVVQDHEGIYDMFDPEHLARKVFIDGRMYIRVADRLYDAHGHLVE